MADGDAFWDGVRDQTHPFFAAAREAARALWRLSVKSTAPFSDLGGDQLVEWGGALRWLVAGERTEPREGCAPGRRATADTRRCSAAADKSAGAFQPLSAPLVRACTSG